MKDGRDGISGLDDGNGGTSPAPDAPALRAALCAYDGRSLPRPLKLPPRLLYCVLVDLFRLDPGIDGRMMSPLTSSETDLVLSGNPVAFSATSASSSSKFGSLLVEPLRRECDRLLSSRSAPS